MEFRQMTVVLKSGVKLVHLANWETKQDYDLFRAKVMAGLSKSGTAGNMQLTKPLGLYRWVDVAAVLFQPVPDNDDSSAKREFFGLAELAETPTILFEG